MIRGESISVDSDFKTYNKVLDSSVKKIATERILEVSLPTPVKERVYEAVKTNFNKQST